MRAAYVYDEQDGQGPFVLLCAECIRAEKMDAIEAVEGEDWRCACCGASPLDGDGGLEPRQIAALQSEAGAAGDLAMVAICEAALAGDEAASAECARVIADAQAQAQDD